MNSQDNQNNQSASRDSDGTARKRSEDEDCEAVAVPSNTATNNSINGEIKVLRYGVDSLYLSYQGNLHPEINQQLIELKKLAQSDKPDDQAKAQLKLGDHLFEVKDKGSSMFSYVLEDNAFRISLSRPNKAVPMAYIKISSEYLTYKLPHETESHLNAILNELGVLDSGANVSRIDMFVDFVSYQDMEAWKREAWVTRAASVNAYSIDQRFTGWAIGLGAVMAARLYDKKFEILSSQKGYLIPLWRQAGWQEDEPVWRLEFEFKRDMLVQKDLAKLSYVLSNMNGLWSYATTEWLKLTIPNHEDQTRTRWPIHPLWASLASIDWETSGGALKSRFSNERTPRDSETFKRAFSALTTWMASHGHFNYDIAIHDFYEGLNQYINNRAMDLGLGYEQLVEEKVALKARTFNTIDTNEALSRDSVESDAEAYRKASDGE